MVAARHDPMDRGQAEWLMPMLEEMLAGAGIGWRDLSVIGTGTGPGNFTGIRIAVAAARGLALSLGIPAVGVSGFAAAAEGTAPPVLCSLDARRGQFWLCVTGDHPALSGPVLTWMEAPPPALIGSGLDVVGHEAAALAVMTGGRARPAPPLAPAIARIADARRDDPGPRPAPLYLRAADAAPPSDPPPMILP